MDAAADDPGIRFNRFLPYWAVLQTDLKSTLRSWVYRFWVLLSVCGAAGYLLYNVGVHREAGMIQAASLQSEHLLRGLVVGGLGLVSLLAVSSVSAERSTVADSILSRGISRNQYFLAKWHARSAAVVVTFALLAAAILLAHHFLFEPDLTLAGGAVGVGLVALALLAVVAWGVTVGAMASGTVMGITVFWLIIYGGIVLLALLPEPYPTPSKLLARFHLVLRGEYEPAMAVTLAALFAGVALVGSATGLVAFARKDV